MNLGEKIYQQRTKKRLSQGDLAKMLNVSRQSISKWENNTATPDLEKIVKMSEIFEISLDELIKGEENVVTNETVTFNDIQTEESTEFSSVSTEKSQISNIQRITGIILLCMAFLVVLFFTVMGGFLGGIIFASPFLVCGVICLTCKRNAGLWCAWAIYILLTAYLIWATGITWSAVFLTLYWTPSMNYLRLATSWALFIYLIVLVAATVKRFSKSSFESLKEGAYKTAVFWIVYGAVKLAYKLIYELLFNSIVVDGQIVGDFGLITFLNVIFDCLKLPLFTIALVYAARLLKIYRFYKLNK